MATQKGKTKPRQGGKSRAPWGVRLVVAIFGFGLFSFCGAFAWSKGWIPGLQAVTVAVTRPEMVVGAAGANQSGKSAPVATPKAAATGVSTYTELGNAEMVGAAPAGWRVEPVDGVQSRVGPVRFSNGSEIAFVIPSYQLVPETVDGGIYIIEPGREAAGGGATIPDVIDKFSSQATNMQELLDTLDSTLIELGNLRKPVKEEEPAVDEPVKKQPR